MEFINETNLAQFFTSYKKYLGRAGKNDLVQVIL